MNLFEYFKQLISEYNSLAVELLYEDSSEYIKGTEFEIENGYFSFFNISVPQFSEIKQNIYSDRFTEC